MISIQNSPSTTLYNKLPNDIVDVTKTSKLCKTSLYNASYT